MTDSFNPYAPPVASLAPEDSMGIWQDGPCLVLRHGAQMPCRCVKCNSPTEASGKKRQIYWHHPALYVLLVLNLFIYLLVALIVRKSAKINPALCPYHQKKRTQGILIGWGGVLLGIAAMIMGAVMESCALGLVGGLFFLGGIVAGIILARVVLPQRIDSEYVRLKGCGQAFLDSFPPFNG